MKTKILLPILALLLLCSSAGAQVRLMVAAQTAHSVTLTWSASTVTAGSPAVAGYNVYGSLTSSGPYTKKNTTSLIVPLTYTDLAVSPGQTWFYVVTGVNTAGTESSQSMQVSATTPGSTPPPTALTITTVGPLPSITVGVPDSFQIVAQGGSPPYTWTATGASSQHISTSGVLSGTPTGAGTVMEVIKVTDSATPTKATATLSFQWLINPAGTVVAVSISPTSPSVVAGTNLQMTARVTGSSNTAVTWTTSAGTISSSGLFNDSTVGTTTVTATSVADPTKSASTTVKVTAVPPPPPTFVCNVQSTTANSEVLTVTISNFTAGQSITVSCPVTHP